MNVVNAVRKVATTLTIHKKKSLLGLVCMGGLGRYVQKRETNRRIFGEYCREALQYGNERILATMLPRRVAVIIKDQKTRSSFEKYALPLLNLAGLRIDLVVPEDYKQLKAVASLLSKNDADSVYVVGENETVSEALTGLLQPQNGEAKWAGDPRKFDIRSAPPIAVLSDESLKTLKAQCDGAMAVIRNVVKDANVLRVQVKDADPMYVLNTIEWGKFVDVEASVPRYWYWGPLKNKFAYVWHALMQGPVKPIQANVEYVEPCSGCSKCCGPANIRQPHWLIRLFGARPNNADKRVDYSKIDNPDCGALRAIQLRAVEIAVKNNVHATAPSFNLAYGPAEMGTIAFVKEGWTRCADDPPALVTLPAREMNVNFKVENEESVARMSVGGRLMNVADFAVKTIPKGIQLIC